MIIDVVDLFSHFTSYFDKILFLDKTNNIQDTVHIKDNGYYNYKKFDEFLEEYGNAEVIDWEYVYHDNLIDIKIESEIND